MKPGLYLRSFSRPFDANAMMQDVGVCQEAMGIMAPKMAHFVFMVRGLDARAANILKQEMLSVGGEAAISYHTLCDLSKPTDCLLSGTERQFRIAMPKLASQPFGLAALSSDLAHAIDNLLCPKKGLFGPLELADRTAVMGILNLTPDSFSGDGITDIHTAVDRALAMESQGADIIDIGGESTRPGAGRPGTGEELERVMPVIRGLAGKLKIPISIDSRDPSVIREAVGAGARMANLVGGIRTGEMANAIAEAGVPVILMHMQEEPETMQQNPQYLDVMDDINSDLGCQISLALKAGVKRENIAVDPGIGFGKTPEHNLEILRRLVELRILGFPIVIGASRKSFIGKVLGTEADDRLEGSLASAVLASANGANIVRVHDVRESARALKIADSILGR
ncbi:MAG: dihydropteroate synthase [Thermoplasmata archaeon]